MVERQETVSANLDLKALRARYTAGPVPRCRVCGGELSLQACGGGEPSVWACAARTPGRTPADEHYCRSEFVQRRTGDSDVITAIDELERSRAEVDRLQKLIANDGGWTVPRQILEELRAEPVGQPPKMRGKKAMARLLEALTPSGATKAAYSGEFRFSFRHGVDEDGNDVVIDVQVPWTTIKAVMAAILKRAEVAREDADGFPVELVAVADPETDLLGSVGLASSFDVRRLGETCRACHASFDEPACGPLHALIAHERRLILDRDGKLTAGGGGDRG